MRWQPPDDPAKLVLERVHDRLELRGADDAPGRGIYVDLSQVHRQGMRNTPLGRAVERVRAGARTDAADGSITAVDATAGLCGDALLLALLGCHVTAIERSPLLAQLAQDGLERAAHDARVNQEALARLRLVQGDARAVLPTLPAPDIVLLDPMFPARRKASALAGKEIRLVRAAAMAAAREGASTDAGASGSVATPAGAAGASDASTGEAELLAVALRCARKRVLVKRADDSPPLAVERKPDLSFSGRTSRIDVYLVHGG